MAVMDLAHLLGVTIFMVVMATALLRGVIPHMVAMDIVHSHGGIVLTVVMATALLRGVIPHMVMMEQHALLGVTACIVTNA